MTQLPKLWHPIPPSTFQNKGQMRYESSNVNEQCSSHRVVWGVVGASTAEFLREDLLFFCTEMSRSGALDDRFPPFTPIQTTVNAPVSRVGVQRHGCYRRCRRSVLHLSVEFSPGYSRRGFVLIAASHPSGTSIPRLVRDCETIVHIYNITHQAAHQAIVHHYFHCTPWQWSMAHTHTPTWERTIATGN